MVVPILGFCQNGVEFEEELNGMLNKIVSLWPRFPFKSDMILEIHAMSMCCWPNVHAYLGGVTAYLGAQ